MSAMNFEETLELYKSNVIRVCKMFSQEQDEQKDLFQEISIQLYRALPTFQAASSLTTFIYRVSINTCMRYKYTHRLGEKKLNLEDVEWYLEDDNTLKLSKAEKLEQLYACINRLNNADKSVVLLFLEDLSHREIAEIAGITENHVAVKMGRIRERLFKCLTINPLPLC